LRKIFLLKKTITFIINPIAGGIQKEAFPLLIKRYVDSTRFDVDVHFTQSTEHNAELARQAVEQKKDIIVAVGGDGTINHVAKFVAGSSSTLALIPMGSGNGLARHLGIPLDQRKALQLIAGLKTISIDTGKINDEFFINLAGAGFDAHVSRMFSTAPQRGFWSYAKITLTEFARYRPRKYELLIDGRKIHEHAFLVCVANGSQFGNNAFIAPRASLTDGVLDVILLKPFRKRYMPFIGFDLFTRRFHKSGFASSHRGRHIVIKRADSEVVNIDGEPVMMENDLDIRINHASLKVIIP
jgi:YegS/Rv2252/BmrU family lipid kinase